MIVIKMSSKIIQNNRKNLLRAERERSRLLSELLDVRIMLRGSYALVYTKCGKDTCRCKQGKGHPHPRISWSEKGKGITRKVPRDQIAWVREVTENYREFRSLRRSLISLEAESKKLLDDLENALIERTRKGMSFLGTNERNRKKISRLLPKKTKQAKVTDT